MQRDCIAFVRAGCCTGWRGWQRQQQQACTFETIFTVHPPIDKVTLTVTALQVLNAHMQMHWENEQRVLALAFGGVLLLCTIYADMRNIDDA